MLGSVRRTGSRAPGPAARQPALSVPLLQPRFLEPPGFEWADVPAPDGALLRTGRLGAPSARGQCVIVPGFTECIEKYFETMRDLAARGFDIWCLDWRGQGGSARPRRMPRRPRPRRFERDAADLAHFVETRLAPRRRPAVLIAHSMGGAIALLALHRHPRLFDAAILSAPMLGLSAGGMPLGLVRSITAAARAAGLGLAYIPGAKRWRAGNVPSPETSRISSDPERCRLQYSWFAARPHLVLDGPTYGWLDEALRLVAQIGRPEFLSGIRTPILLGSPGIERIVSPEAQRRAAALLPDCTLVELPDSKHEPFLERDPVRERWLAAIDHFLDARLGRAS
jgi:lysophospholipase